MTTEEKQLTLLKKIAEAVDKNGRYRWYDSEMNKLVSQNTPEKAMKLIGKKIKENRKKWEGQTVVEAYVNYYPDEIMNDKRGGIAIIVEVSQVLYNGNNLTLDMKNKKNSMITIFYNKKELKQFKYAHIKKVVQFMLNETYDKISMLKDYQFSDIKDDLQIL